MKLSRGTVAKWCGPLGEHGNAELWTATAGPCRLPRCTDTRTEEQICGLRRNTRHLTTGLAQAAIDMAVDTRGDDMAEGIFRSDDGPTVTAAPISA